MMQYWDGTQTAGTLTSHNANGSQRMPDKNHFNCVVKEGERDMESEYTVRRLTPTECARLQGFPDDWCADVPHSDSAEYKLWGNGIALPCVIPIMKRMKDILERETT